MDYQAKLRELLRCQLMALPNGAELYMKALPQIGYGYLDIPVQVWEKCENEKCSAVVWCLHWSKTVEGHEFWSRIHYEVEKLIRDNGTFWLTSLYPTFVEIDENEE